MSDIIKLCIIIVVALFLIFSIISEFKNLKKKNMFWFSIDVMFLLVAFLLIKDYIAKHVT
jgi:hypothetical protein